jgi:hypothetical protein
MEACDADLGASLFFAGSAELLVVSFVLFSAFAVEVSALVCFVSALTLLPFLLIATLL